MEVTGVSDTPSRLKIFSCRPTAKAEEEACAAEIIKRLTTQAFRGAPTAADLQDAMKFYEQGREKQAAGFEAGIRLAVQSILMSPRFLFRLEQQPAGHSRRDLSDRGRGSRVAPVVLPLGHGAGRGTGESGREPRIAQDRGGAREAGAPHARRPQVGSARDAVRLAVAAAAGSRQDFPGLPAVSAVRRHARARHEARNRAVLRLDRPRGSQREGSADGGLHVRQRAARQALRHSEHHRQRVPARGAAAVSPRPARPGQHPDADVGGGSHLAGAARQVGDGSAARLAAAGAAAERAVAG